MGQEDMSSHDIPEENLPAEQAAPHRSTGVARETPLTNPGQPPQEPRVQALDEQATKRSERIATLRFTLSMLASVAVVASFVAINIGRPVYIFALGRISAPNLALGASLFAIGVGAVHWSGTLMSDKGG